MRAISGKELLSDRAASIADRWFDLTVRSYPEETARFLSKVTDQFANPVGQALRTETAAIVPLLLSGAEPEAFRCHLEPLVKVRAVQDYSHAQSLAFVFLLKEAIREELAGELGDPAVKAVLEELDRRVDRLALAAFDSYVQCRELISELRVREMKRSVAQLYRMASRDARRSRDLVSDASGTANRSECGE